MFVALGGTVRANAIQSNRFLSISQSLSSEDRPKSTKGLQPKILNENPPTGEEQSEDVKQHNKEMEQMADKANSHIKNEDAYKDKESPPKHDDEKGLLTSPTLHSSSDMVFQLKRTRKRKLRRKVLL